MTRFPLAISFTAYEVHAEDPRRTSGGVSLDLSGRVVLPSALRKTIYKRLK